MALTIATGFVVDDAVVVLENVSRHIEDGMSPSDAALQGAREVGFTVVSMSISLIAVFVPILLMGGIIGRLFREFAVTLFRRHFGFVDRFAHYHADDVRTGTPGRKARKSPDASPGSSKAFLRGCCVNTEHTLRWALSCTGG